MTRTSTITREAVSQMHSIITNVYGYAFYLPYPCQQQLAPLLEAVIHQLTLSDSNRLLRPGGSSPALRAIDDFIGQVTALSESPPHQSATCEASLAQSLDALNDLARLHSLGLCHRDISHTNLTFSSFTHRCYLIDLNCVTELNTPAMFMGNIMYASDRILSILQRPRDECENAAAVPFTARDDLVAFLKLLLLPHITPIHQLALLFFKAGPLPSMAHYAQSIWSSVCLEDKLAVYGYTTLLGDLDSAATSNYEQVLLIQPQLIGNDSDVTIVLPDSRALFLSTIYHTQPVPLILPQVTLGQYKFDSSPRNPELVELPPDTVNDIVLSFNSDSIVNPSLFYSYQTETSLPQFLYRTNSVIYEFDSHIHLSSDPLPTFTSFGLISSISEIITHVSHNLHAHLSELPTQIRRDLSRPPVFPTNTITVPHQPLLLASRDKKYALATSQMCTSLSFFPYVAHHRFSTPETIPFKNISRCHPALALMSQYRFALSYFLVDPISIRFSEPPSQQESPPPHSSTSTRNKRPRDILSWYFNPLLLYACESALYRLFMLLPQHPDALTLRDKIRDRIDLSASDDDCAISLPAIETVPNAPLERFLSRIPDIDYQPPFSVQVFAFSVHFGTPQGAIIRYAWNNNTLFSAILQMHPTSQQVPGALSAYSASTLLLDLPLPSTAVYPHLIGARYLPKALETDPKIPPYGKTLLYCLLHSLIYLKSIPSSLHWILKYNYYQQLNLKEPVNSFWSSFGQPPNTPQELLRNYLTKVCIVFILFSFTSSLLRLRRNKLRQAYPLSSILIPPPPLPPLPQHRSLHPM